MDERNNDGKKVLIALVILILLLLAALVWFLFFFKGSLKKPAVQEMPKVEQEAQPQLESDPTQIATSVKQMEIIVSNDAPAADQKDVDKANLEKMASLFAERLGSYSNQSDFSNITDLDIFMTKSMRDWADAYVEKSRNEMQYDGVYRGTVTRAVLASVDQFDDRAGTASAMVYTQRVESSGFDGAEIVYYEDLAITFKKEDSAWLVDFAKWQGRKNN